MKIKNLPGAGRSGFLAGTALLVALTGCTIAGTYPHSGYRQDTDRPGPVAVVVQDDYDYYPGYETYYSRSRHEFVYRDGNAWVRRPEPRNVTANVMLAAPSVRMDFHDSPEQHHNAVVKAYPKAWKQPANAHDSQDSHQADKKAGPKDEEKQT